MNRDPGPSAEAAAEIAGVPVPVFLTKLGEYDVPVFRSSRSEIEQDLAHA